MEFFEEVAHQISAVAGSRAHRSPLVIKKKRSKSIKSSVSIHDRTHVEATFSYSLVDKTSTHHKLLKDPSYHVDAYLFLPPQIGINPSNYKTEQFYNDLRAFIRLREPKLSLRQLRGEEKDATRGKLPINYLRNYLYALEHGFAVDPPNAAIEEARVFGCAAVAYFWKRVDRRRRRIGMLHAQLTADPKDDFLLQAASELFKSIEQLLTKARQIADEWRTLMRRHRKKGHPVYEAVLFEMQHVDEYLSYSLREGLLMLLQELTGARGTLGNAVGYEKMLRTLRVYLRAERWYGKRSNYIWISPDSSLREQETFLQRRGMLKKRISSVLYLNPRPQTLFRIQRHVGAMVAAGMAGGWAVLASVFIWSHSNFRGFQFFATLSAQSLALICMAFVVSYVLKDRIKEVGRNLFARSARGILPDLVNKITYDRSSGEKLVLGKISEFMSFIKTRKLPLEIAEIRAQNARVNLLGENLEECIIHYAKQIRLKTKSLQTLHRPVRAVSDVLRLSVEPFLPRLDDPFQKSLSMSSRGEVVEMQLPKIYSVDLVLRYSSLGEKQKRNEIAHDFYRLMLDKQGLTRIDQLNKF